MEIRLTNNKVYDEESKTEGTIIIKDNKAYVSFYYKAEKIERYVVDIDENILDFINDVCLWEMQDYILDKFMEEWE